MSILSDLNKPMVQVLQFIGIDPKGVIGFTLHADYQSAPTIEIKRRVVTKGESGEVLACHEIIENKMLWRDSL